jgi:cytidylate kinase
MAILTITGDLASGKSMVAKELIKLLDAQYFSTGNIQRGIAADMGMTTLELNKYSETHPEIDDQIDGQIKQLANKTGNFVVDSRMAWHFLPASFKIYLSVDVYRAAERVMKDDQRSSEPAYQSADDAVAKLAERKTSENKRYIHLYQADCANMDNFDVVVDSTHSSPQDTLDGIMALYKRWQQLSEQGKTINHYWLSPNHLYPVQPLAAPEQLQSLQQSMQQGFDDAHPVDVVQVNKRFYLYQGHKRAAAAISQAIAHIPVNIVATDEQATPDGQSAQQYVEANFTQSTVDSWSNALDCQYLPVN